MRKSRRNGLHISLIQNATQTRTPVIIQIAKHEVHTTIHFVTPTFD